MLRQEAIDTAEKYYLPVFGRLPLVLDHGQGCKVYDMDGREFIDCLDGIAVNCLGYNHPVIVKAVSEQAAKLMHCSNIFYTEIQAKAVRVISEITGMDRIFLTNSGAESNEGALKLARKYGHQKGGDKKYRIITAKMSFHGRTMATLTATGQPHYQEGYGPLPAGYDYIPYGDIEALEAAMGEDVCGLLLEPIQGEGGVHVPSQAYIEKARELCDKYDALLIFDEIQTGVGRTGAWFEYMNTGVKPDVLTFAKGIGGGFPMGGFAVPEKLAHVFAPGDHGGTFGGNALACSVAYAVV
ncbi:MAG: aminotransferase class III-fold pyridoxal phosphate-dependent enzyme, partial [Phascolarctobacterium sp.]|nr:aminotransferase class III-fold pyridoxal phosphate-dependent enzyme [Phascolarctobacterium sp.]